MINIFQKQKFSFLNNCFLILLILLFCFCEKTDCVEITRKEKSGSNFLFFFEDEYNSLFNNPAVLDQYGAIPSGSVSEEVYNNYDVGDVYCIE